MKCDICPRDCKAERNEEKGYGFCGESACLKVAKSCLFMYEEPCISGTKGSGCIFFSGCTLRCVYCQNYEISQEKKGKLITVYELAQIFKNLEEQGAHNINLVNPSHFAEKIVEALKIFRPSIPIVWNTHGYEKVETLEKISPYVDIFLTDLKYFSSFSSKKYSNCENYFEIAKNAVIKMTELKPNKFSKDGLMKQGVLIRHLVLPLHSNDSLEIIRFVKKNCPKAFFSLMAQYTPMPNCKSYPEINRKITEREYNKVKEAFVASKVKGYAQELDSSSMSFIPDFDS